ncbi:hypothetical protein B0I37DRAFT_223734 [Chaetomium sp. MPI-CAGE-AT-0009]|nr:hypothetical protein B0I37DRAFT_223734 [Chaetomium sp. MPI-CAGE-AT-0009]
MLRQWLLGRSFCRRAWLRMPGRSPQRLEVWQSHSGVSRPGEAGSRLVRICHPHGELPKATMPSRLASWYPTPDWLDRPCNVLNAAEAAWRVRLRCPPSGAEAWRLGRGKLRSPHRDRALAVFVGIEQLRGAGEDSPPAPESPLRKPKGPCRDVVCHWCPPAPVRGSQQASRYRPVARPFSWKVQTTGDPDDEQPQHRRNMLGRHSRGAGGAKSSRSLQALPDAIFTVLCTPLRLSAAESEPSYSSGLPNRGIAISRGRLGSFISFPNSRLGILALTNKIESPAHWDGYALVPKRDFFSLRKFVA